MRWISGVLFLFLLLLAVPASAQLDFHETFENGSPCGLDETWVGTPTTITNAALMTGNCYLADPGTPLMETGLAADEMWFSMQVRNDNFADNDDFTRIRNSASGDLCRVHINNTTVDPSIRVLNTGGTATIIQTGITTNTNYIVEVHAKKGTGANAVCGVRVNGGSWVESTNGTWTTQIDRWWVESDGTAVYRFDEIKRCAAGAVGDGACDEPAVTRSTIRPPGKLIHVRGPYRIQPVSYPDAEEEAAYVGPTPTPLNGRTPITWSAQGTLPSGLSIASATGVISGTPAAASAGTYPFTLVATTTLGGLAFRSTSLTVIDSGSGSLTWVTEDGEDGNLTADPAWNTAGSCSATALGVLEGSNEVSMDGDTPCVLVTGLDIPEIYVGWDEYRDVCPATDIDPAIVVRDSGDNNLVTVRIETDCDMFVKIAGLDGDAGRGFKIIQAFSADPDRDRRVDFHFATGTGANAVLRARTDNGTIQEFSLGTATANIAKVVFLAGNDSAGDFMRDRVYLSNSEWANLDPLAPGAPPPASQPWLTNFDPVRTHYVDDIACGGDGLTISTPECSSTALSTAHYQNGDLHTFREGLHHNSTTRLGLSKDCLESAPCVFKGYVDPATGQPERARFNAEMDIDGDHNWVVNIEVSQDSLFSGAGDRTNVTIESAGSRVINSVIHDSWQRNNIAAWSAGPGQVIYGNVIYRPAVNDTAQPTGHNIYTQNDFNTYGWKYYIQNISMERSADGVGGSAMFQARSGADEDTVSGFHLEANLFAEGPDNRIQMEHLGTGSFRKMHTQVWKNNVMSNFASGSGRSFRANGQAFQAEITGNYFAKTSIDIEGYWGNVGAHNPFIFTGNELYDPAQGYHIRYFSTQGIPPGTAGSHKFSDQDVWNNNTFGGTFKSTLHCNGTNFGDRTLAQWRTATDNCRVTPDAGDANGFDINSTNPANPTVNKIVVLKNEYQCPSCVFNDQARGNIYIVNWENATSDIVDISTVVGPGKTYTVRYARDFYGTAAASGTCPGSGACNVTLNIRRSAGEATTLFTEAYVITGQS